MATEHQVKRVEKELREYRKKYLTKKQNLEVDESATRLMVNSFLTDVLGYAELDDIKTEYNIKGEYADYVVQLARKKHVVVEVKSIQLDLNDRHLRQSFSYAVNEGIDWILLFNGRNIRLYRVLFAKPVTHHLVFEYDLSELSSLRTASAHIEHLTKRAVLKGELDLYWKRFDALTPVNLAKTIYTEDVIKAIRLKVKKTAGISFDQSEILAAAYDLLQKGCSEVSKPRTLK